MAKGATLYLPVEVAGALLSMGDAHTAQGDSELDGTGIETSINGGQTQQAQGFQCVPAPSTGASIEEAQPSLMLALGLAGT